MNRVVVVLSMLGLFAASAAAQFTDWSAPVNLGPVVNSPYTESCVTISKNGLSLFFFSNRYAFNSSAAWRLYVSKRMSVDAPWGTPEEIVGFNEGKGASCPALSPDEHRLVFVSTRTDRADSCGGADLWVSRRHDRRDDFGWGPPENLGCQVNSASFDQLPTLIEDETGTEVLFFSSGRPGSLGAGDVYQSRMRPDGTFGPAVPVTELNTPYADSVAVRRDGLELILATNRPGGPYPGTTDLWTAHRESTADPWSAPVPLPVLSSAFFEGARMSFSFDGRALYFNSDRPGGVGNRDLWIATREKLRH